MLIEKDSMVRNHLIELARKRANQTVTYQKLSDECKLQLSMHMPDDRKKIGIILGRISTFEYRNNRPLLSALVLRLGDDLEGDGFYKLAEELGFGNWKTLKNEGIFEAKQIGECIDFWSSDENYNRFRDI